MIMKIKTWIKYNEGYLPTPRCRKLRYREQEEYVDIELMEVPMSALEPAFNVGHIIYGYAGKLWKEAVERDVHCTDEKHPMSALEALIYARVTYSTYFGRYAGCSFDEADREDRDAVIARANNDMAAYILVDGILYVETSEPIYNITTFGLGHNHGGTGFFVSYSYNPNLSKESYFNALEYEKAINYAIDVAARRGDTDDVARFKEYKESGYDRIKVYDSKYVTRNPQQEHGDGDKFLNDIEKVIEGSDSVVEAGLLCMMMACCK